MASAFNEYTVALDSTDLAPREFRNCEHRGCLASIRDGTKCSRHESRTRIHERVAALTGHLETAVGLLAIDPTYLDAVRDIGRTLGLWTSAYAMADGRKRRTARRFEVRR